MSEGEAAQVAVEAAFDAMDSHIATIEEYLNSQVEREPLQGGGASRPADIPTEESVSQKAKAWVKKKAIQAGQTAVGGAIVGLAKSEWDKTKSSLKHTVKQQVERIGDHLRNQTAQQAVDRVGHLLHGLRPDGYGLTEQQMRDRARRDSLISNQPSIRPGSIAEAIVGPSTPTRPPPAPIPSVSTPSTPPPSAFTPPPPSAPTPPPPPPSAPTPPPSPPTPPPPFSNRPPPMSPIIEGTEPPTPVTPSFVSPSIRPSTVQASNYYAPQFSGSGPALSLGQPVPYHSYGFARRPPKGSTKRKKPRKGATKTKKRISDGK